MITAIWRFVIDYIGDFLEGDCEVLDYILFLLLIVYASIEILDALPKGNLNF